MKLQQESLAQTGIAILEFKDGHEEIVPLFSEKPVLEADNIALGIKDVLRVKHTFVTNSLIGIKLGNDISDFESEYGFLPQDLMGELRSGFSYIYNTLEFNQAPISLAYK